MCALVAILFLLCLLFLIYDILKGSKKNGKR